MHIDRLQSTDLSELPNKIASADADELLRIFRDVVLVLPKPITPALITSLWNRVVNLDDHRRMGPKRISYLACLALGREDLESFRNQCRSRLSNITPNLYPFNISSFIQTAWINSNHRLLQFCFDWIEKLTNVKLSRNEDVLTLRFTSKSHIAMFFVFDILSFLTLDKIKVICESSLDPLYQGIRGSTVELHGSAGTIRDVVINCPNVQTIRLVNYTIDHQTLQFILMDKQKIRFEIDESCKNIPFDVSIELLYLVVNGFPINFPPRLWPISKLDPLFLRQNLKQLFDLYLGLDIHSWPELINETTVRHLVIGNEHEMLYFNNRNQLLPFIDRQMTFPNAITEENLQHTFAAAIFYENLTVVNKCLSYIESETGVKLGPLEDIHDSPSHVVLNSSWLRKLSVLIPKILPYINWKFSISSKSISEYDLAAYYRVFGHTISRIVIDRPFITDALKQMLSCNAAIPVELHTPLLTPEHLYEIINSDHPVYIRYPTQPLLEFFLDEAKTSGRLIIIPRTQEALEPYKPFIIELTNHFLSQKSRHFVQNIFPHLLSESNILDCVKQFHQNNDILKHCFYFIFCHLGMHLLWAPQLRTLTISVLPTFSDDSRDFLIGANCFDYLSLALSENPDPELLERFLSIFGHRTRSVRFFNDVTITTSNIQTIQRCCPKVDIHVSQISVEVLRFASCFTPLNQVLVIGENCFFTSEQTKDLLRLLFAGKAVVGSTFDVEEVREFHTLFNEVIPKESALMQAFFKGLACAFAKNPKMIALITIHVVKKNLALLTNELTSNKDFFGLVLEYFPPHLEENLELYPTLVYRLIDGLMIKTVINKSLHKPYDVLGVFKSVPLDQKLIAGFFDQPAVGPGPLRHIVSSVFQGLCLRRCNGFALVKQSYGGYHPIVRETNLTDTERAYVYVMAQLLVRAANSKGALTIGTIFSNQFFQLLQAFTSDEINAREFDSLERNIELYSLIVEENERKQLLVPFLSIMCKSNSEELSESERTYLAALDIDIGPIEDIHTKLKEYCLNVMHMKLKIPFMIAVDINQLLPINAADGRIHITNWNDFTNLKKENLNLLRDCIQGVLSKERMKELLVVEVDGAVVPGDVTPEELRSWFIEWIDTHSLDELTNVIRAWSDSPTLSTHMKAKLTDSNDMIPRSCWNLLLISRKIIKEQFMGKMNLWAAGTDIRSYSEV